MLAPTVLWAQRTDEIFITIDLMDIENPTVNLTSDKLYFQGRSLGKDYEVELKFFSKIDPEVINYILLSLLLLLLFNRIKLKKTKKKTYK